MASSRKYGSAPSGRIGSRWCLECCADKYAEARSSALKALPLLSRGVLRRAGPA
ncbi:Uncharacterised protein [Vibrio cholerae]|nr:Uncharacterised protein [Vibrio cholerae]